jgi:Tfp pilus assembly pilus retraction ATPase PilT
MQTHRDDGMWLLERHLAALARRGLITVEEARAHAQDQSLVETYLGA